MTGHISGTAWPNSNIFAPKVLRKKQEINFKKIFFNCHRHFKQCLSFVKRRKKLCGLIRPHKPLNGGQFFFKIAYRLPGVHFHEFSIVNRRVERTYRGEINDILNHYDNKELQHRYRFSRQSIEYITRLVYNEMSSETSRTHSVSAPNQVLVTLRFLARFGSLQ